MTKKKPKTKVSKKKGAKKDVTPDLPQNIVPVGERVFDDKNIYIHQKVYAQIHKFAANKTENEHGGVLVGRVLNEMGKETTIIEGFIEAKYNAATPTTLTFTHETWEYFHAEMDRKYKGKKIVGWIHTHPNFGIFLSENDKFIQENFFSDLNQVAYVVDPIQKDEGFFFWVNQSIERCPGFYLYDKNGAKIKEHPWNLNREEIETEEAGRGLKVNPWLAAFLAIIMFANLGLSLNQAKRIKALEKQVTDSTLVIEYSIARMYGYSNVTAMADKIRYEIAEQERVRQQAIQDALKKQQEDYQKEMEEKAAGTEVPAENTENTADGTEQPAEGTETADNTENNTENNGGQEEWIL